jgi:curved DNA-binding protein CbpA
MYPFFVLDVPLDATDAQVQSRYDELVRRYPPDRFPKRFQAVRNAYEKLRTETDRLQTFLCYYDKAVTLDANAIPDTSTRPRRRFSRAELAEIIMDYIADDDR